MDLSDIVSLAGIVPSLRVQSKKQAIQELSSRAAKVTGLSERDIFDTLLQREQLGSTGIGHGIAIPHGKLAKLTKLVGLFARLDRPVDFDAIDDQPVDLIFVLLAPEGAGADHLKALATVARLLRDPAIVANLRACRDVDATYSVLIQPVTMPNTAA
jgi:PTS system nitrogen regulatory IIA component